MDYNGIMHQAKQEISTADYMNNVTNALMRDKNVLLNVFLHADNGIMLALSAYLVHLKNLKKIRMIPASEELKRQIFFESYSSALGMSYEEKRTLNELKDIVSAHKNNQIEFNRGDEYVIVLNNYKTITVTQNSVTKYLSVAKGFINKVEGMLK
jgi:hypothetical protein